MVRVVDRSNYGYGYFETNKQLAKELSEVRQQLAAAVQEIQILRDEVHRCHVRLLDYEVRDAETAGLVAKYNAIENIILNRRPVGSIQSSQRQHQTTSIQALSDSQIENRPNSPLRLPSVSHLNESNEDEITQKEAQQPRSPSVSSRSSSSTKTADEIEEEKDVVEEKDEEEEDQDEEEAQDDDDDVTLEEGQQDSSCEIDNSDRLSAHVLEPINEEDGEIEEGTEKQHDSSKQSSLPTPSPTRTITPINDSLEPADVTSVPPINQLPERTIHTPSIWNCLDPLESGSPENPDARSDQLQKSLQKSNLESPARSTGSSTNGGLRISQNMNSTSPIQPITRKSICFNFNEELFHSTPVQGQKGKANSILLNKRSISDPKTSSSNQENRDQPVPPADELNQKQKRKRGRPAGSTSRTNNIINNNKKKPVRRAVKFTEHDAPMMESEAILTTNEQQQVEARSGKDELVHEGSAPEPATRYNLRKRAKV